jgi:hypothetical protein
MIDAALEKRPSAAASARMARALGVTVTTIGTAAASKALAATATGSKASTTVATSTSAVWPWVSVGVLGLAVAGAVVGVRVRHVSRPEPVPMLAPQLAPSTAEPSPSPRTTQSVAPITEQTLGSAAGGHRAHRGPTDDLRDQIALVDSARDALGVGSPQRALEILRRYQDRYPSGSFRPEATATTIEALVKLGRDQEARALATRFVAEHRGSLLATRVAELVGLPNPPAAP